VTAHGGPRAHPGLRLRGGERLWPLPEQDTQFGWLARHPVLVDLALPVAVAVVAGLSDVFGPDYRSRGAVGWDVLIAVPLVLRRRRPEITAALVAAICLAQWFADVRAVGDGAFLIALYSLGAYERRRWVLLVAVLVAELGVVMAVTRWGAPSNQLLAVATGTGTVTASWVAGIYMSMRRAYVTSMRDRAESAERDRDSRAQVAVAAERARLAREMHDVIAHSLSVMITLNDGAAAIEPTERARDAISQASEVGRQALSEMRRMLGVLRDGQDASYIPQPGLDELPDLVSMVRSAGLRVELATTGDLASVSPTAQLALYRIVQESLTNVLKHARNVERVTVEVARIGRCVDVRVDNDGSCLATAVHNLGGQGLSGMCERARLFGGGISAGPVSTGGWSVRAHLELEEPEVEV
jgi:signal transduction histidine kinase